MRIRQRDRADGNSTVLDGRAKAHGVSIHCAERPVDRLWGLLGVTWLCEYKNPATHYGRQGLNPKQKKFAETWRGSPVRPIATVEDVDRAVAEMRMQARVLRVPAVLG